MQPEEVLELIGSASQRYDTVRAALPGWFNLATDHYWKVS